MRGGRGRTMSTPKVKPPKLRKHSHHVFFAHHEEEDYLITPVVDVLEKLGFTCNHSGACVPGGWVVEFNHASIEQAKRVVFCLSPDFWGNPLCLNLLQHAMCVRNLKNLKSIQVERCKVPENWKKLQADLGNIYRDPTGTVQRLVWFLRKPSKGPLLWRQTRRAVRSAVKRAICSDMRKHGAASQLSRSIKMVSYSKVAELKVTCPYPPCVFSGTVREMVIHESVCDHVPISCPHPQCSQSGPRATLREHIKTCPLKTQHQTPVSNRRESKAGKSLVKWITSLFKAKPVKENDLPFKASQQCPDFVPVVCTNPGCKDLVLPSQLERHLSVCKFATVTCPYKSLGCPHDLLHRWELVEHVERCEFASYHCISGETILRKSIKNHEPLCSARYTTCQACSSRVERHDIRHHKRFQCPKTPVFCEHCCSWVTAGKYQEHIRTQHVVSENKKSCISEEYIGVEYNGPSADKIHQLVGSFKSEAAIREGRFTDSGSYVPWSELEESLSIQNRKKSPTKQVRRGNYTGTPSVNTGHIRTPSTKTGLTGTPSVKTGHIRTPSTKTGLTGTPSVTTGHIRTPSTKTGPTETPAAWGRSIGTPPFSTESFSTPSVKTGLSGTQPFCTKSTGTPPVNIGLNGTPPLKTEPTGTPRVNTELSGTPPFSTELTQSAKAEPTGTPRVKMGLSGTQPFSTKSTGTQPAKTEPTRATPVRARLTDMPPIETGPTGTPPVITELNGTTPIKTVSNGTPPVSTELNGTTPIKAVSNGPPQVRGRLPTEVTPKATSGLAVDDKQREKQVDSNAFETKSTTLEGAFGEPGGKNKHGGATKENHPRENSEPSLGVNRAFSFRMRRTVSENTQKKDVGTSRSFWTFIKTVLKWKPGPQVVELCPFNLEDLVHLLCVESLITRKEKTEFRDYARNLAVYKQSPNNALYRAIEAWNSGLFGIIQEVAKSFHSGCITPDRDCLSIIRDKYYDKLKRSRNAERNGPGALPSNMTGPPPRKIAEVLFFKTL
ncbi:uncharacterized protein LOC106152573 [Lingula anatina]|uniref:Uncharacterized protein LOC106152573 n=1 Tax=Lingula anatina TaxID=7574 RepID=A0A1S3H842_LINAN|nr:uncharacterized protein LOC106152573 [Lingula anatina]|eukprot:XP_013381656.1 uncharacterized protein LOC106152573 [Lingula anatina]